MTSLGFFLSTILHKTTAASNAGWGVLILGFIIQLVLFSNPILVYVFYADIWWLQMIRYTLQTFYPPFNFSKAFIDIAQFTQPEYNKELGKFVSGKTFNWKNLYDKPKSDVLTSISIVTSCFFTCSLRRFQKQSHTNFVLSIV